MFEHELPGGLYGRTLEDCDEDRTDPDSEDDKGGSVDEATECFAGEDAEVGGHDGKFGEGHARCVHYLADEEVLGKLVFSKFAAEWNWGLTLTIIIESWITSVRGRSQTCLPRPYFVPSRGQVCGLWRELWKE